ncbi:hypothetical protein KL86PLE_90453 [uncultured Pleomorphomonas sp.]|uniref:Uncharacterized protein n=1 Tax=uncultured Pleomorphomonas sp. TaxID=442121 RepID=A0A212LQ13_9HYPH|nr:hypothetical protein KL86PLE_90453 [uncultured Pleomorphomonas sp.]
MLPFPARDPAPARRMTPDGQVMDTPYICFIYIILSSCAQAQDLGQNGASGRYRAPPERPP